MLVLFACAKIWPERFGALPAKRETSPQQRPEQRIYLSTYDRDTPGQTLSVAIERVQTLDFTTWYDNSTDIYLCVSGQRRPYRLDASRGREKLLQHFQASGIELIRLPIDDREIYVNPRAVSMTRPTIGWGAKKKPTTIVFRGGRNFPIAANYDDVSRALPYPQP